MTYEDASRDIINYIANGCYNGDNALCWDTLNTAVSALDKQIPKNPDDVRAIEHFYHPLRDCIKVGFCPECINTVINSDDFCSKCGQALDWNYEEREEED